LVYQRGKYALNEIQGVKNYRMHTFESSIGIEDPAYQLATRVQQTISSNQLMEQRIIVDKNPEVGN